MISVIVPVYNVAEYLDKCIESIRNQSYVALEIILVDDGSNDGSSEICDRFAAKDKRIAVIHKENGGVVSARKEGLRHASGEYVGFVDGDDWIEPDMYEILYRKLTKEQVDISMCGRFEDSNNETHQVFHGIPEGRYDKQQMLKEVYPRMIVNGGFFRWGIFPGMWDKLFRRGILEKCLMEVDEEIVMGEDAACSYPCLLNAESIYILHKCLYHYRQTQGSMVRRFFGDKQKERERFRILYHSVNKIFEQNNNTYDLRSQWLDYLLFLMIPRADYLYEGYEDLDYLFPFPEVKRGSRIVVYGAGLWGQRVCQYLKTTDHFIFAGISDKNDRLLKHFGQDAVKPGQIRNIPHDAVIITASYADARKAIIKELTKRYPNERIFEVDEAFIHSDSVIKAFGLQRNLT